MLKMRVVFLIVIFSPGFILAQVFVNPPGEFVSIIGGSATFFCSAPANSIDAIVSAQWLLNNTLLEDLDPSNVVAPAGTLQLGFSPVTSGHHMTRIRCRAMLESGTVSTSDSVLLLIQGHLSAVGSLNVTPSDSTLSLTWTAPFTLDITGVDPDISGYCVDVVNSTSSSTLHSQCGITETEFSYPTPPDTDCHIYTFTVTPVNVVGMGEATTVAYVGAEEGPESLDALRIPSSNSDDDSFTYLLNMSAPVCSAELISIMNDDTRDPVSLDSTDLIILMNDVLLVKNNTSTVIAFTAQLADNHHYIISINASNSAGSAKSNATISTHGIIDAFVIETERNKIIGVMTRYFEHSSASGALYVLIAVTDGDVDFTCSVLVSLNRSTSKNYTLPFSLSAGQYRVFVYDIEENQTLISGVGYSAVSCEVSDELVASENCSGSGLVPTFVDLKSCTISCSRLTITAECAYSNDSMATDFQIIAILDQAVNKIYVNQTMDGQTLASVEVERNGQYLVSIIPIVEGTGITDSSVEYTEVVTVEVVTTSVSDPPEFTTELQEVPDPQNDIIIGATFGGAVVLVLVLLCTLIGIIILLRKYSKHQNFPGYGSNVYEAPPENVKKKPPLRSESTQPSSTIEDASHEDDLIAMPLNGAVEGIPEDDDEDKPALPPPYKGDSMPPSPIPSNEVINANQEEPALSTPYGGGVLPQLPMSQNNEIRNGTEEAVELGDHYAAVYHSAHANDGNLVKDTKLHYAVPAGCISKNNQTYAYVDLANANTSATDVHEVSRDVLGGVIYSDIQHKSTTSRSGGGTTTREYRVFHSNIATLNNVLKNELALFTTHALAANLISQNIADSAQNIHYPTSDRASHLLQILLDKISLDSRDFSVVLEILWNIPSLKTLATVLEPSYCGPKASTVTEEMSSSTSNTHAVKSASPAGHSPVGPTI